MQVEQGREGQRRALWFRSLDSWWLDVKLGGRMLVKFPGLALVGAGGIAVAVAIAAGGFSVTYSTYLAASLPLEEGDRIVSIETWDSAASKPERRILYDYRTWRDRLQSIQEIGAFRTLTPNLIATGITPASVRVASMSASGFRVARVRPLLGRYLVQDDEREGAPSVAVIGEGVWRSRFASDPAILGRAIQLGAAAYSIVGVMPESFAFPVNHRLWVPLRTGSAPPEPLAAPDIMVFGRLAPGATLARANAELAAIGQRTAQAFPKTHAQLRPQAMPYANPFMGVHGTNDGTVLHVMQVLALLPLVLVCMNIAILVYTRTAMRQAEIAIRTALGAARGRIVAQLFIEALVLSAVGALAGVGIAAMALRQLAAATSHIASDLPFWVSFQLSPGAVLYACAITVLAAAIVGIVPALQTTRRDLQTGLRIIGSGGSGMRLGKTWTILIVAQVGFAVALLPASVSNSWHDLRDGIAGPGFAAEEFLSAELGMDDAGATPELTRRFTVRLEELMRRLNNEPRVSNVTYAMVMPGDEPGASIEIQGALPQAGAKPAGSAAPSGSNVQEARFNRVDVNFFHAFDVPILAGRGFEPADITRATGGAGSASESRFVVINQSFALKSFGGDALGRRIRYASNNQAGGPKTEESGRLYEIVGIVSDFPTGVSPGMDESPLKLYHPMAAGQAQTVSLGLRVRGSPATFVRRLEQIAIAVDPDLHLRNILGMDEALRRDQWISRLRAAVLGGVTLSVLMLSSAGIYALMSFTIERRRKEIGIRMALGADRTSIVGGIFSRAFGQLALGAALGVAAAAVLERWLKLIRGDAAVVLPVVALLVMTVGFLAVLGPARRSLRIEPTEALREQ